MAHEVSGAHADDHESHQHGSTRLFVGVFIALCVLTSASIITYTPIWRDVFTPQVGWSFMMAVSCAKALLVITFFMHLLWEANWKFVLTIPAAMMSVFLICMLVPDIGYRTRHYSHERAFHAAVEKMGHEDHDDEHHDDVHQGVGGASPQTHQRD